MPHLVACRTSLDHRDAVRAVDDAAEDVRSSHPHSQSARRHSPNVHRPSAILDVRLRVAVGRPRVMRAGHRRDAARHVGDRCAQSMRSARGRRA